MATLTLNDVLNLLESAFPPGLAQPWDSNGLICGHPLQPVRRVHFALDPVAATVEEAIANKAELLVTHHPLYLRPTSSVAANTPKGALIHRLIQADCALYNAHTNADSAAAGTAMVLARRLALTEVSPIDPAETDPALGLGRYGNLPKPIPAAKLGRHLADILPSTVRGVALGGDPERIISSLAICPGAGDSYLDRVRELGIDALLTSDLRHHRAGEALEYPAAPVLFDAAHFATESPWLSQAADLLQEATVHFGGRLDITISRLNTDPWTAMYTRKETP